MSEGCVFCDQSWMRAAEIFIETPHCIFASTRDPDIRARAGLAEGVLPGSGAIVPIAHRTSVFELTPAEWADTRDLLLQARMALHDLLAPDGYLLGWNQGGALHPHMHVIPRFDDEPLSDRWLRSARENFVPGAGSGVHRTANGIMLHLSSSFRNDRAPDVQVCALAPHRGQYDRPDV